ncbi:HEAT repeat domain-containing protein [Parachlamydia sp. AcF125]|uniref:HEAT repeat domain-containing protein n=1 Tax=Parachlamydia sp. AcF125 TaxID=2795736 RepID=UPI001BC9AA7F|nr:HEAT repeat domain-containing protein [Parachlamydia sp. AcF125]MBS4168463.1 Phosphocholine transferase AnkX [Parachlamydia sp. AcF125]
MCNTNISFLLKADQVSDYIPGISTITNSVNLFQKFVVLPSKQKANVSKSHYYAYLQQKSFARCVVLLIPVIGNIIIGIYDFAKSKHNQKGVATPTAAQPISPSSSKSSQSSCPPGSVSEQGFPEASCREHSLTESFMALYPALGIHPVVANPQASAVNPQLVGENAQLIVQAIAFNYSRTAPPSRLSGIELNKRLKELLQLKCPHCIKDLIAQGHKFLREVKEEISLDGVFYLATAYELYRTLNIQEYRYERQAFDEYLGKLEERLADGQNLLHYFAAYESKSIFIYLFAERPNIHSHLNALAGKTVKETPLQVAIRAGSISIANFLFEQGADVKKPDSSQNNVLHHACLSKKDCPDLVRTLLRYDPTFIEAKNSDSKTPLHLAALAGNQKCVECLLGQTSGQLQLDQQDGEGNTSLHLAIMGWGKSAAKAKDRYCAIIQTLVKKGANLHLLNKEKKTALMLIFENEALIQALVQAKLTPKILVSFLQHYYLSRNTLSIFKIKSSQEWEFKAPLEEIYVRLGMIERKERNALNQALDKHSEHLEDARIPAYETIGESKEKIEIEKLFEHKSFEEKARKRVFIQGAAGIGKSTLCHYISYHWAKGKLWAGMFACLFWIPLRNLTLRKYPPDKEYTPADLIAKEYAGKIDRRVIEACINEPTFLQNTLLVLDGYDELSSQAQGNTSLAKAFKELKELFPHILITSRPGGCSFEHSCELEILGFDKEEVKRYVDRFFKYVQAEEKKQKFNRLLNTSPQVLSLAQIPINLTLLCCLFNEDSHVFDTEQSTTMSAIYARVVNWMYQWFLLRRIDQGKSDQTKEQILTEKNLRQNKDVAKIAAIFEKMADFAMKNDILYLSKQEIEGFRGNKISSNELTDCGLMRIPKEETAAEQKGYFIHLTFQEFLTASKVANQYLKGERQACQTFVRNYKFEPRYALVLRMIAGCLSLATSGNRQYVDALQNFFDDLFAAPQDLAVSSELTLIAECFEECQDPSVVKQYDGFIELVKDYMKSLCLLGLNFERLFSNKKLFSHPEIVRTIGELLSDRNARENMLNILLGAARARISLASEIVGLIVKRLKVLKGSIAKRYVIDVLKELARQGAELPEEALAALIQALKEGDSSTKGYATSALKTIAEQGGELPEEVLTILIQRLKEGDAWIKDDAACALKAIAKRGNELSRKILAALIEAFKEGNRYVKSWFIGALGEIAEQGGELPKEALAILIQALKEGTRNTKDFVAIFLAAMAKQAGELSEEVLAALIQVLKEGDEDTKDCAAFALTIIAKQGDELSRKALAALIEAFKEENGHIKMGFVSALGEIVEQGEELPKEALIVLTRALKEGYRETKEFAAIALVAMTKQTGGLSEEALTILVQALKEGDRETKHFAAIALTSMTKQAGGLSEEALTILIQALKEGNYETKCSVARALAGIIEQGGELPKEPLAALTQALEEGDHETKCSVVRALVGIAEQGGKLPKEVLVALPRALKEADHEAKYPVARPLVGIAEQGWEIPEETYVFKEDDNKTRYYAARVLRAIVKQGDGLPEETLAALIQALKENNDMIKYYAASVLGKIVKQEDGLLEEILPVLTQALKENNDMIKYYAASALGEIAQQRGELSPKALFALIQAFTEGDSVTKSSVARAFEEIAQQGGKLPKEALAVLMQAFEEDYNPAKNYAARALEEIAKQGGKLPEEALAVLIQALEEDDNPATTPAIRALVEIAKQRGELSTKALSALAQTLKADCIWDKRYVASSLVEIAKQGARIPEEVLAVLIQVPKEDDSSTKVYATRALEAIAEQGSDLPKEALVALTQALEDSWTKKYAASALGEIAKQGGKLSEEALVALIQAFKDDYASDKEYTASALVEIAKQGCKLSEEAVVALIQDFKDDCISDKKYAASALVEIAKQGDKLSEEALAALIQVIKEADAWAKDSAAEALKNVNKNALLKMSSKAFALTAEICFFTGNAFSVKGQKIQISDKRTTCISNDQLKFSYEQAIEKLPLKLAEWRKQLDSLSPLEGFQRPTERT